MLQLSPHPCGGQRVPARWHWPCCPPGRPRGDGRCPAGAVGFRTRAAAPYRLRIVGNLGALSQYSRREAPFWTRIFRG